MKQLIFLGILASALLSSCSKDDQTPALAADFSAAVTGESPNAQITITNNSTGASTYAWTFGDGASIATSTDRDPGVITIDKAGDLSIKLVVGNGSGEKELVKSVTVSGTSAIVTYADVAFGLDAGDATYGRLFSFSTGKIYKDTEIDATNGPLINLAFGSMENTLYFFESPTTEEYKVPNATATKVVNYQSTPSISIADFNSMTDDSKLSGLTITGTHDGFGNSSIPGTILFETSTGRKGVIKTKAVNSDRMLVDIKIQKY